VIERPGTPFTVARSVARGAEKWVDVTCHASPASFVRWAEARSLPLVAAHPEGEWAPEEIARLPSAALVLGNERDGISAEVARACTHRIRVPMRGFTESLNVSAAAAILLSAATRGRPGDLSPAEQLRLYARGLYLSVERAADILAIP
jgi:tRNA (guanosine-2'-O-)-methyltransferase